MASYISLSPPLSNALLPLPSALSASGGRERLTAQKLTWPRPGWGGGMPTPHSRSPPAPKAGHSHLLNPPVPSLPPLAFYRSAGLMDEARTDRVGMIDLISSSPSLFPTTKGPSSSPGPPREAAAPAGPTSPLPPPPSPPTSPPPDAGCTTRGPSGASPPPTWWPLRWTAKTTSLVRDAAGRGPLAPGGVVAPRCSSVSRAPRP